MSQELESALRYRHRAEEVRAIAELSTDSDMRRVLLRVAEDYETMANTLERIAARDGAAKPSQS